MTYFTTKEAAVYLNVSKQYLEIARHKKVGPPYLKLGKDKSKRAAIKYSKEDLDTWMEGHRVTHVPGVPEVQETPEELRIKWEDDRYGGGVSCHTFSNLIRLHVRKKLVCRGEEVSDHPYVMWMGTKKMGACRTLEAGQKYLELKYCERLLAEAKALCNFLNAEEVDK